MSSYDMFIALQENDSERARFEARGRLGQRISWTGYLLAMSILLLFYFTATSSENPNHWLLLTEMVGAILFLVAAFMGEAVSPAGYGDYVSYKHYHK